MKRVVFSLIVFLVCQSAAAQKGSSITGGVKEKSSVLPSEFPPIVLRKAETLEILTGGTTDTNGKLRLTNIPAGTYFIESSFVEQKIECRPNLLMTNKNPYKFKPTQLIIPATLIGAGIIGLESDWLKYQNHEMRDELQENIDKRVTIDNILQYTPMVTVYGLNLCGIKGKHGFADRTILLGTAYALMGITVNSLKTITKVERPDGSSRNSFPSGHTATAFMGAEFLRREYWNVSPWIGVAGYAVATGTGFFRMYNNRHWLTDVVAGAGIGVLSVQAAYWLYPTMSRTFFHKQYVKNTFIAPYISSQEKGLSCRINF